MTIAETAKPHDGEVTTPERAWASRATAVSSIAVGVAALAVACAFVLIKAQAIVLTVFGAIVIAEAVRPFVDRLTARAPRMLSVAIVFATVVAATAAIWWLVLREIAPQFALFARALPGYLAAAAQLLVQMKAHLPPSIQNAAPPSFGSAGPVLNAFLGAGTSTVTFVSSIALALLLAIFWLETSDSFRTFLLSIVRNDKRADVDALFRDLGRQLAEYATGTVVNGAIVVAASILALLALRAPYPMALGLVQGLLIALPYVGTLIGVLTVGAVVVTEQGPVHAAVAVAVISIVASLEGSFVAPRVFKKTMNLDPFSTTLAVAIGATLFGIAGVILAVPAAAVVQTLVVRVLAPAIRRTE